MKFSKKGLLNLKPEKHSYRTLSLAYANLTEELMKNTQSKNTSKRSLQRTSEILIKMKELGDCVAYCPRYFDEKGNALVALLRHGAKYLEKHEFFKENLSSSSVGELFAYLLVMKDPRMHEPMEHIPFAF